MNCVKLLSLFPVEPGHELQTLSHGVACRPEPDNLHVRLVYRPSRFHHGHDFRLGAVSPTDALTQYQFCEIKTNIIRRIPPSKNCGPFKEYSSVVDIGFWASANYNPVLFSPPFMALVVIILLYVLLYWGGFTIFTDPFPHRDALQGRGLLCEGVRQGEEKHCASPKKENRGEVGGK